MAWMLTLSFQELASSPSSFEGSFGIYLRKQMMIDGIYVK